MRKLLMILGIASFCVAAWAAGTPLSVAVDNKPALAIQLPEGWTAKNNAGTTTIKSPKFEVHIQLWHVPNAKTVADAVARVPDFIKGEVTEFKAVATSDIKVAGVGGKHIIGTGSEADDGDPSNAEVFLFSVGGKVFLVCAHGEGAGAANARASILQMLASAKKP
jgi:hypothetical protein